MNTLEAAFLAWLSFLSSLSVDTEVVLNPPASDTEISFLDMFVDGRIKLQPNVALDVIKRLPDRIDPRTYHYTEAKVRSRTSPRITICECPPIRMSSLSPGFLLINTRPQRPMTVPCATSRSCPSRPC